MTITLQAVNELIQSLESAGEREKKFLKLAKEFRICSASLDAAIKTGNVLADQNSQLAAENVAMKQIIDSVTNLDNEPQYHDEGMGCGLEDRGITDRYDACRYGWDEAMERIYGEVIPCADELDFSATDRIVAGIKADGVKEFAESQKEYVRQHRNEMDQVLRAAYAGSAVDAERFAAQLREGADK
ncbi:hypothetical protein AM420_002532 [Klebsiella pneumoniae]|uniref:hypothetical protein n=1 Tax=Klebsiella pneumoniae TaxID=573 RepID=UPI0008FB142B|nr:hypothetical protein [Klebsiella pneumoniae]ASC25345.1 hypothetical protein AM386_27910 [Klebsiella pneumoniae]OKN54497.1 hypothetical protein AM420_002532 [Klebsiella pneumoniae]HBX2124193.1 hypothetical protein [Klebsiella pneumoniae]